MKCWQRIGLSAGLLFASSACAQVTVHEPWVRATAPGQPVAGAYLKIKSAQDAAIVSVRSPVAARAEVHEMKMDGGLMKMRPVARLELPADKTVELKPGGYHVMLVNVAKPLQPGDMVPITLVIDGPGGKQEVEVKAEVRSMVQEMGSHGHDMKTKH